MYLFSLPIIMILFKTIQRCQITDDRHQGQPREQPACIPRSPARNARATLAPLWHCDGPVPSPKERNAGTENKQGVHAGRVLYPAGVVTTYLPYLPVPWRASACLGLTFAGCHRCLPTANLISLIVGLGAPSSLDSVLVPGAIKHLYRHNE